jgi:hypothetical protein
MTPRDARRKNSDLFPQSPLRSLQDRGENYAIPADVGLPSYLREGLVLPYGREQAARFHVLAAIAAITFAAWVTWPYQLLSITALLAGCSAYYFFPFTERRPRLGANRYGLFVDGLGLIAWSAIGEITLVTWPATPRMPEIEELHIRLSRTESSALLVDWRRLPYWRLLMRLPWTRPGAGAVRINLQPFDSPAKEIHCTIHRLWLFHSVSLVHQK